jgi:hypothetical protein
VKMSLRRHQPFEFFGPVEDDGNLIPCRRL